MAWVPLESNPEVCQLIFSCKHVRAADMFDNQMLWFVGYDEGETAVLMGVLEDGWYDEGKVMYTNVWLSFSVFTQAWSS